MCESQTMWDGAGLFHSPAAKNFFGCFGFRAMVGAIVSNLHKAQTDKRSMSQAD